ncbi:peroxin-4 [Babesia microti strain RI]|uniref:Peroxin-4 n=1 Tax=Babesia microti (strain RI) TaxID=1133968 RepID=I7J927_BABMR|nr:peroxin-4 [Babesia microti strain RI]CCF73144.1 peroxin-4 [Babesia microti strain RI]|eukprot:XP_012647753.1 peroxin-4 [Babesia microti strain RI]
MSLSRNRILNEVRDSATLNDPDVKLTPKDNFYEWEAVINGPTDTPYENGSFKLSIHCPMNYPISPPIVHFLTRCFHPNINFLTGELCLDLLKSNWTPAWTILYICKAIIYMLGEPNAESPLNCDAGNLIREGDIRGFNSLAKMYTHELAMSGF